MDYIDNKPESGRWLIWAILLCALLIRLYGIDHGMPHGYQIDEKFVVNHAAGFGTGDLNPHVFHWPGTTLMYFIFFEYGLIFAFGWLFGLFQTPMDFAGLFIADPTIFYLTGRITIALLGTATVYLIYRIGRNMYSERAGLLAAVFYAFSYMAVGIDHFVFPDGPLTFFCVLGMLLFYRIMKEGGMKIYLLSGLLIGAAIGTKYNAGAMLVPLVVAHLYRVRLEGRSWLHIIDRNILIAGFMIIAGFAITCPFCFIDFKTFYEGLVFQFGRVSSGSFSTDVDNAYIFYLMQALPVSAGIGLAVVSVAGVFFAAMRRRPEDVLVGSFIMFYYLYMGSWKVGVEKYILPILPFLMLFAAMLIDRLSRGFHMGQMALSRTLVVIALLLIAQPFAESVRSDYILTTPDTRTQAKEWIENNIPQDSRIAIDAGNFDVGKLSPPLIDSAESVREKTELMREKFPEAWEETRKKIEQYMELQLKYQKGTSYRLLHIVNNTEGVIDENVDLQRFRQQGVEYVVISSYAYEVYQDSVYMERNPEVAAYYNGFYSSLDDQGVMLKAFHPLTDKGPGPVIKIYKISL